MLAYIAAVLCFYAAFMLIVLYPHSDKVEAWLTALPTMVHLHYHLIATRIADQSAILYFRVSGRFLPTHVWEYQLESYVYARSMRKASILNRYRHLA